jgi:hypothetical protein
MEKRWCGWWMVQTANTMAMDRDEGERVGRRIITHQKEKKTAWLQEEK